MVKVPKSSNWLKAADLKPNSTAKIISEADWEETTYKGESYNQFTCMVEFEGAEKKLKLTMASCNEISPVYGEDTKDWVGKILQLESIKVMVGGQVKHSILASPIEMTTTPTESEQEAWDKE